MIKTHIHEQLVTIFLVLVWFGAIIAMTVIKVVSDAAVIYAIGAIFEAYINLAIILVFLYKTFLFIRYSLL